MPRGRSCLRLVLVHLCCYPWLLPLSPQVRVEAYFKKTLGFTYWSTAKFWMNTERTSLLW